MYKSGNYNEVKMSTVVTEVEKVLNFELSNIFMISYPDYRRQVEMFVTIQLDVILDQ